MPVAVPSLSTRSAPVQPLPRLYRARRLELPPGTTELATAAATRHCEGAGLDLGSIEVLRSATWRDDEALVTRLEQVAGQVGLPLSAADLVCCETAFAHVDEDYMGQYFLSVVLATGPQPYVVQSLALTPPPRAHRGKVQGPVKLESAMRILHPGDVFGIDPLAPHLAAPAASTADAFLVLMQWTLDSAEACDRERILHNWPPLEGDRSQESFSDDTLVVD